MICTSEHYNFHIQDCLHIFWSWWFWHCWFEKPDIFCWCYPKHQKCSYSSFSCLLWCPAESNPEDPQVTGPTSRQVVLQGMCLLPDINTGCDHMDFLPAARLSLLLVSDPATHFTIQFLVCGNAVQTNSLKLLELEKKNKTPCSLFPNLFFPPR